MKYILVVGAAMIGVTIFVGTIGTILGISYIARQERENMA